VEPVAPTPPATDHTRQTNYMPMTPMTPMTASTPTSTRRTRRAGIEAGHATFEVAPPTWAAFDTGRPPRQRWVALTGDVVLGGSPRAPRRRARPTQGWWNTACTSRLHLPVAGWDGLRPSAGQAVGALDAGLVASASAASVVGLHLNSHLDTTLAAGGQAGLLLLGAALGATLLSLLTQRLFVLPMTDLTDAPEVMATTQCLMPGSVQRAWSSRRGSCRRG